MIRNIILYLLSIFVLTKLSAQEVRIDTPYFKVLKTEKIDFDNISNSNVISNYRSFSVKNEKYIHLNHQNKYGIYNLTKNRWVINFLYDKVNSINDSLYHLVINNYGVKLLHIDKKSTFNLFCDKEIEVKKEYIIQSFSDGYPHLINVRTNIKRILPYKTASFINETLIRVSNENDQFNVIDLKGNIKFNKWWDFIYYEDDKLFASYRTIANNQLKIELNSNTGELSNDPVNKVKKNIFKRDKISKKFKLYREGMRAFPILLDTFILNDDKDIVGVIGNKYISLVNANDFMFTNLDLKKLKAQDLLVDSISYSNNPHYLNLYKDKKSGIISSWLGLDLSDPKHELISIFGNSITNDKLRYFVKSGDEISIFDKSGILKRNCPCDNPFRASLKKSGSDNDIIICFQNGDFIHAYDINGVTVDLSTVNIKDEDKNSINLNILNRPTIFQIGGKYGVISKERKLLIPPIYEYIRKTSFDGIYLIEERTFKDRFVHLIDTKTGQKKTYPGLRLTWSNLNLRYFDLENRKRNIVQYEISLNPFKLIPVKYFKELVHLKSIIRTNNGMYGLETFDGKIIIEFNYEYCYEFDNRLFGVKNHNNKYAIFNEKGIQLTNFKFDTLFAGIGISKDTLSILKRNYNSGSNLQVTKIISGYNFIRKASSHIIVEKNGKLGCINLNGDIAINAENDWISNESRNNKFLFKRNGKFYFNPRNENEIFRNGVDTAYFFKNIKHQDDHGVVIYKIATKHGLHRPNLQYTEALFDDIYEIHGDYLLVEIDRKLGLYDIKRQIFIVDPSYNGIFFNSKEDVTLIKNDALQTISIINGQ